MSDTSTNTNRRKGRLYYWVAGSIALVALLFTAYAALTDYAETYKEELRETKRTISQLAETVEDTAAIAAYLDNQELAKDVVRGLLKNDIVAGAVIISDTGMDVRAGSADEAGGSADYSFPLASPFSVGENVGMVVVTPKSELVEGRAKSAALDSAQVLAFHTLVVALLAMFLVNRLLTRPLTELAAELHDIEPGSDTSLSYPRWHRRDEIGGLVDDTNQLLSSVRQTLNNERALRARVETLEKRFRLMFERASAGIFLIDWEGTLLTANHAFRELVGDGLAAQMENDKSPKFFDLFENPRDLRATLAGLYEGDDARAVDLKLVASDKHPVRWLHCLFSSVLDDEGGLIIEGLLSDVTERTNRERRILFHAEHDPLTRLLNRRAGEMELNRVIDASDRKVRVSLALLMLDLDRFKPINDELGHDAGDMVLKTVSERLRRAVRGQDILIRWGGDEFVIGLLRAHGDLDPEPVAHELIKSIGRKLYVDKEQSVNVGVSIGIALFPAHAENLNRLVACADKAMYRVKQSGRNGYQIFDGEKQLATDNLST